MKAFRLGKAGVQRKKKFPMIVASRQMPCNRYDGEMQAISPEAVSLEISDAQRMCE